MNSLLFTFSTCKVIVGYYLMGCIFFFFISNSLLSRYFFVVVLHDSRILIARINAKNVLAMRSLKIASLLASENETKTDE